MRASIVERYKAIADIERGFRVLKGEIEIAPVYHRLPERTRAHASLCFMALILYRVMHQRLNLAGSTLSPDAALAHAAKRAAPPHSNRRREPISGIGAIHAEQAAVFAALKVNKPSLNADSPKQLNLV